MAYEVSSTDAFDAWLDTLTEEERVRVLVAVGVLAEAGPTLGRPRVDTLYGSAFANMKELRVQSGGEPLRIFFAFDPRRTAVLLIGDNKKGDDRFYTRMISLADTLYREHLVTLEKNDG